MRNAMVAIYPGSFDPITLGHLNIMERTSRLFDRLVVAVGSNCEKLPWFTPEERAEFVRISTASLPNVSVEIYEGLTVNYVRERGAKIMIRGVRPLTDISAEITMMMANRRLAPDVETLFLVADGELAHVSSSLIKEIAGEADAAMLASFLPPVAVEAVMRKVGAK
ncbi:MAG: pantetheine-phosphate adenylyltransferase [Thermoguttaceae bacterium]|jgi:pantetheine-phosphate adenylyltransferase